MNTSCEEISSSIHAPQKQNALEKTHDLMLTVKQVADELGLSVRTMRRVLDSGATILLNAGVPLEVVAHILGDSIEVARTVYAHVLNRTAAKAMRKGFRPIKNPSAKSRVGVTS